MNEPAPDSAARERALDPAGSFLVVAPAGSGKTSLLTLRLLTLLARVDEPEVVVAITFTRKAAEEMRGRVLEALAAADEPAGADAHAAALHARARAVLANDTRRGWRLREQPQRLRIQTIDSLAATLARRVPLVSELAIGFDVREQAGALYSDAARAALVELVEDPRWSPPLAILLGHLDNDWQQLEALLADMLARRDQWLRLVLPGADRSRLEAALAVVAGRAMTELRRCFEPALAAAVVEFAALAGASVAIRDPASDIARLAALGRLPGSAPADLPVWRALADLLLTQEGEPRKKPNKHQGLPTKAVAKAHFLAYHAQLGDALAAAPALRRCLHEIRRLPPVHYDERQWRTLTALFDVLKLAAARLTLSFADHQSCDFVEVSRAALAALGEPEAPTDLSLALDHQIEHLLVDEFQDTSVTQALLLERLLAGWTGSDGRTLFLVGDPRQSIYRFRQAEVQLFLDTETRRRFAGVALEVLHLTANFRAVPALIAWLNHGLPAVFANGGAMGELVPLKATRDALPGPAVEVHTVPFDAPSAAASKVLEIVTAARAGGAAGSIGILVRSRAQLGDIPAALVAAGIPIAAVDLDPLGELPLVNDLLALTRALLALTDRIAWLALQRAPWCGLPLAAIAALCEDEPAGLVWDTLRDPMRLGRLDAADRRRLGGLTAVLDRALALRGRCGIAELVEGTWLALGGPACAPATLRYARRYLDLLARHEQTGGDLSPPGLAAMVAAQYAPLPALDGPAVSIMTIHRAKGLEFDVVILPGLERAVQAEPKRLLLWHEVPGAGGERHLLFAAAPEAGADDALYDYLRDRERSALEAEANRLLYVALTRARRNLHLVASIARDDHGLPLAPVRDSLLHRLWPVLGTDLAAPAAAVRTTNTESRPSPPRVRLIEGPPRPQSSGGGAARREAPEYEWARPTARHVGTVAHLVLQLVGRDGLGAWDEARLQASAPAVRGQLRARGVAATELPAALGQVLAALARVLASPRGRWMFDPAHVDAASERALTAMLDGRPVEAVVDRSFVDSQGTRWIIDFKMGTHLGGDLDAFLDAEVDRYRPQLARYARVFGQLEARPTRLALYYPLLDAWREWPA